MRFHSGERPFKCTVCQTEFVYSFNFKRHMRCHTGRKTFNCIVCLKELSSNLKHHMKFHMEKAFQKKKFSKRIRPILPAQTSIWDCTQVNDLQLYSLSERTLLQPQCHKRFHMRENPSRYTVCHKEFVPSVNFWDFTQKKNLSNLQSVLRDLIILPTYDTSQKVKTFQIYSFS